MSKIPEDVRLVITRVMPLNEEWDTETFLDVFRKEVESRELCERLYKNSKRDIGPRKQRNGNGERRDGEQNSDFSAFALVNGATTMSCVYCGGNHTAAACDVVVDITARISVLRKKARCFACLRSGHRSRNCRGNVKCKKGKKRHHESICTCVDEDADNVTASVASVNLPSVPKKIYALLQTAKAVMYHSNDKRVIRVLFDIASQRSFVRESVRDKLKLPFVRKDVIVVKPFKGSNTETQPAEQPCQVDVVVAKLRGVGRDVELSVELCVVPEICSPISSQYVDIAKATYQHLTDLELADTNNGESELGADVLIGVDFYWDFFTDERVRAANRQIGPVAENTVLGWVLSGPCEIGNVHVSTHHVSTHVLQVGVEPPPLCEETRKVSDRDLLLIEEVKKFWEVEDVDEIPDEKIWDDFSKSITYIDSRQQYQVELLWKTDPKILPDNFSLAFRCLYSTFARLKKKEGHLIRYDKIIRDQLDEGIIELVEPDRSSSEPGKCHYLSHHPVVKENRKTTKMRMVFNGSGALKGHPSLNDCLESGPCLLPKLFDNIVRFRAYTGALCTGCSKTYDPPPGPKLGHP